MRPERWRKVEELYHAASEREPSQRAAFLREACQGDAELESEVESLLRQESSGDGLLGWDAAPHSAPEASPQLQCGDQLGPYEIVSFIGSGGMGEVYRGMDTRLGRPVAIKIVAKQFIERFEREARTIAALNHPHICTLYDVGPDYLVMEYIEGRALSPPIPVEQVIKYALQVADALNAAHAKSIVHRDLKPANILITIGAEVKILDFGLARYVNPNQEIGNEEWTQEMLTQPGTAVGTVPYMSPEQVRGQPVDGRSDLWSLGVILYESLTGMRPFQGPTSGMTVEAILTASAFPLRPRNPQVTPELERIVLKLLEKNREKRYQTAAQLLDDLRELPAQGSGHRKYNYRIAAAVVAVAMLGLGILLWKRIQARPLTDKDVLVLADFTNTTGDPVFNTTLREALSIQIEESPFLKILSDNGVRVDLGLMGRPATERITNDIAREICQRESDKATIGGSIASLGRKYVITLQATNCQTGDTLAREQAEAPDKEHVLEAVSKAARGLRHKMGESLNSIQKLQPPTDRVTTASLQAFQLFAQGVVSFRRGAFLEALPIFRRATELDPNFATAWYYLGSSYQQSGQAGLQVTESRTRAFLLRDRGTERERLMNTAQYYLFVTFEWNKAADITELWARTYPRDTVAYNSRGVAHFYLGQLEDAVRDFQNEYRIEPRNTFAHGNLIATYVQLEQYDEAKKVAETVLATGETGPHGALLWIALIQGDRVAAEQQIRWFAGKPEEYYGRDLRAEAATVLGRLREADELWKESSALRQQHGVARSPFSSGPVAALFGSCGQTRTPTDARDPLSSAWLPVLLVLCGDAAQTAQALNREEETATKRQSDVLINAIRLPMLRAASALKNDHPDEAITILRPVMNYERGRPEVIYLRGLSYYRPVGEPKRLPSSRKSSTTKG